MSNPEPPGQTVQPLSVAIVLTDAAHPSNGELRLLDHLTADPRYEVSALWHAAPPTVPPTLSERIRAAFENRAVPVPPAYVPRHWHPAAALPQPDEAPAADVIVDFSHSGIPEAVTTAAGQGLWRVSSYLPGAGIADAVAGRPVTRVDLIRTLPDGGQQAISHAVYDTKFLARRNAGYIREKSVQLIIHALACLHRDGKVTVAPGPATEKAARASLTGYGYRTAREVAYRIADKASARLGGSPGGFGLRIGTGDITSFDPASGIDVPMPKGHFWADPFLMVHENRVFCLFEDFDYDTGLGQIGAGVLTDRGMDDLGRAFSASHHLSFPFVFRHQGEIFMMPETHQAGRLEIWRATGFPLQWTLHATAFEGTGLADTVLFTRDGAWWMLTGLCNDSFGDFCGELHLFRTSGPDLSWMEPHPLNPVVIGADTARGGGRVHDVGGRLLRVSQDNSGGIYGWGLNVMEIERLSPTEYAERRVRHVTPDFAPGLVGCHHFDCAGGRWILDVRRP